MRTTALIPFALLLAASVAGAQEQRSCFRRTLSRSFAALSNCLETQVICAGAVTCRGVLVGSMAPCSLASFALSRHNRPRSVAQHPPKRRCMAILPYTALTLVNSPAIERPLYAGAAVHAATSSIALRTSIPT